jgi:hypothetical protein
MKKTKLFLAFGIMSFVCVLLGIFCVIATIYCTSMGIDIIIEAAFITALIPPLAYLTISFLDEAEFCSTFLEYCNESAK